MGAAWLLAPGRQTWAQGASLPDLSRLVSPRLCGVGSGLGTQEGCLLMNWCGAEKRWEYFRSDDLMHPAEAQRKERALPVALWQVQETVPGPPERGGSVDPGLRLTLGPDPSLRAQKEEGRSSRTLVALGSC